MKLSKTKCLLILFLTPFTVFIAQDLRLTLNDALTIALQKNDRIKQYQEKLTQKENEELASWGNFLPVINIDAAYTHLNDNMVIDLSPIRDVIINLQSSNQAALTNLSTILSGKAPLTAEQLTAIKGQTTTTLNAVIPEFKQTFKKQDYKTATITGVQPIFLGGKLIAAKNYAASERKAADAELTKIINEISVDVINNYMRVLLIEQIVKTRKNVLDGMINHRDNAKKLFDEGLIANHHFLRAEVAVADAERNLVNDQNNFSLAITSFKHTLGVEESVVFQLVDSLSFKDFSDSLNVLKSAAGQNQPILKLLEEKKIGAEQNYNVARSNLLPTLAAFGKYEMYPEYLSSLEPRWAVGLQMHFNLFNGFKDYLKLQTAAHLENEVKFMQADTKRKIDLWVNKSYLDVVNYKTRYEKLKSTVELATENLRQNEKRFQTGLGTSLEVIDARLSFERVQLDLLASLYGYYSSLADLYLASGNPNEVLKIWSK